MRTTHPKTHPPVLLLTKLGRVANSSSHRCILKGANDHNGSFAVCRKSSIGLSAAGDYQTLGSRSPVAGSSVRAHSRRFNSVRYETFDARPAPALVDPYCLHGAYIRKSASRWRR